MSIKFRHYKHPEDYQRIDEFLIQQYQPDNNDGNWVEPAWEYMHHHSQLDSSSLEKIGIWEDRGKIVAVAHYESYLGEAFFQFHPAYRYLREKMLNYVEQKLYGRLKDGRKFVQVYINDYDNEFQCLVEALGFKKVVESIRPVAKFIIPDKFAPISLPEGFKLKSLADDCNWVKVHRVLWRGFNHEGDPPKGDEELEARRKMFDTPKARRDLKIVVEAPDGNYVSFCGMFYEPTNHYAYVEPMATDPNYRRLGLGKAAILEGIQRCSALGANVAYVGSNQQFYLSLGFKVIFNSVCWIKYYEE